MMPSVACAIAIFIFSTDKPDSIPVPAEISDKVLHGLSYAVLNLLTIIGLWKIKPRSKAFYLLVAGIVAGYSILLEIVQLLFFPLRSFEILDILANIIGVFVSLSAFNFLITKT
jgi:VanZ family protein